MDRQPTAISCSVANSRSVERHCTIRLLWLCAAGELAGHQQSLMLVVVAAASFCGFWQASLTSLMAVVSLDYLFLPPLFHFNITDSQD